MGTECQSSGVDGLASVGAVCSCRPMIQAGVGLVNFLGKKNFFTAETREIVPGTCNLQPFYFARSLQQECSSAVTSISNCGAVSRVQTAPGGVSEALQDLHPNCKPWGSPTPAIIEEAGGVCVCVRG